MRDKQTEKAAILALMMTPGGGSVVINRIIDQAARTGVKVQNLLECTVHDLIELFPAKSEASIALLHHCSAKSRASAAVRLEHAIACGISIFTRFDPEYPSSLVQHLKNAAPPMLFTMGGKHILTDSCAGIVGARKATSRGLEVAAACADHLTTNGATIVSGGADGIDMAAHMQAIRRNRRTVVVLPLGIFSYQSNKAIERALDRGNAVLLSQFAPDAPWETHAAVTRNAVIAALARIVCVIEPRKPGGSVRTARCALDQQKPVLVETAPDVQGLRDELIRAGARPLMNDDGELNLSVLDAAWRKPAPEPAPELF